MKPIFVFAAFAASVAHGSQRKVIMSLRDGVPKMPAEVLSGAGVDLAFSTQVVLFHDQREETDGDRKLQRKGWLAGDNPPKPRHLNEIRTIENGITRGRPR